MRSIKPACLPLVVLLLGPSGAFAQQTVWHLHNDADGTTGYKLLKTAGPDAGATAVQRDLTKVTANSTVAIATFRSQQGDPTVGTIPAGTVINFSVWMRKTAAQGAYHPAVALFRNDYFPGSNFMCGAGGPYSASPALTTTTTKYDMSCTLQNAITLGTTDRLFLQVYIHVATSSTKKVAGELSLEGVLNGNYDSTVRVPTLAAPPSITNLSPASGSIGTAVTITGANFGATQGTNSVTFSGIAAAVSSWTNTAIQATVPAGAVTGPVVVAIGGAGSNGVTFTVAPPPALTSLAPTSGGIGSTVVITGTNFLAAQGSSTVTFSGVPGVPTAWSDTSITVAVPGGAASGPVVVTVGGRGSNILPFSVVANGTLAGTITRASGGAAISGATIDLLQSGITRASATSGATGSYATGSLPAGVYQVRITASGYAPHVATSVSIGGSTTLNAALVGVGTVSGRITGSDGITPVRAAIRVLSGAALVASGGADAQGDYQLTAVRAGTYAVEAAAAGFETARQAGIVVAEGGAAVVNLSLSAAAAGPVRYIYDEVGRLKAVVKASGESATYTHDPVGNILSIARNAAQPVSVLAFAPGSGSAGTIVRIAGTGFSATAASNTVSFNGVAAAISSASQTELVVAVPAGASTGPIAVTSPAGSGSSAASFVIGASTAPTISGFTPTVAMPGDPVSIGGSHFASLPSRNFVKINVTGAPVSAATSSTLSTSVPLAGRTGRVTVATAAGVAVSSDYLFVPPAGFSVANVGATAVLTHGSPVPVTIADPATKIGLLVFDGTAGGRVTLRIQNTSGCSAQYVVYDVRSLFGPGGSAYLEPPTVSSTGSYFFDLLHLPYTGSYQVLFDPSCTTGPMTATFTLFSVPPDVIGTTPTDGTTITAANTVPGQNAQYLFSGVQGQRVSLLHTRLNGAASCIHIVEPLTDTGSSFMCGGFQDPMALTKTGTHRVFVDFSGETVGAATFNLYDVPPDVNGTIAAGGSSVTFATTTPGQNGRLTFSGTAGQRISLGITGSNYPSGLTVTITDPANVQVGVVTTFGPGSAVIDAIDLTTSGTFSINVDPRFVSHDASPVFTLYDLPTGTNGTLTPGGGSVLASTTMPGQNAEYTFAGTVGQRINLQVTGPSFPNCVDIYIYRPTGTTLGSVATCTSNVVLDRTVDTAGTHRVVVNPRALGTGSVTLTLVNVPEPDPDSVTAERPYSVRFDARLTPFWTTQAASAHPPRYATGNR